jgi:hypothetical protein
VAYPKGGPKVGGRKKGTPNKATAKKAEEIAKSGLTPVDYLLSVMRDTEKQEATRIEAAKAVAPYVHPKLANIELAGKDGGPLQVQVIKFADGENPQ